MSPVGTGQSPLRVLAITFDPAIRQAGGKRLSEVLGWHVPEQLMVDYSDDLRAASGGVANFQVIQHLLLDEWPRKADGFRYDDESFLKALRAGHGFHVPDAIDYQALLQQFAILEKIDGGDVDEVWVFGPPYAGLWESTMAGPGAFWCNSPPVAAVERCRRRFVIMGFNYERGVDCMLENFGHRVESTMRAVYNRHQSDRNRWEHFSRYDLIAPGRASCGNVHFAPNSLSDYDWSNPRVVTSDCDDWLNYPNLTGERRSVSSRDWGGGSMRLHHLWWLGHLPRSPGISDGVLNNWWHYILDPNLVT